MTVFTASEWKHLAMRSIISETLGAALDSAKDQSDAEFWRAAWDIADYVVNRRALRQRKRPVSAYISTVSSS
jgi:hypothetical protein